MKKDDKLFLLGLISLVLSLFLLPCAFYLFPMAWLGWEYNVPHFLVNFTVWIESTFNITYKLAFLWLIRLIFISSIIFGGIAYYIAQLLSADAKHELEVIEQARTESDIFPKQIKQKSSGPLKLVFKLLFIICLVFLVSRMMQWAISVSA